MQNASEVLRHEYSALWYFHLFSLHLSVFPEKSISPRNTSVWGVQVLQKWLQDGKFFSLNHSTFFSIILMRQLAEKLEANEDLRNKQSLQPVTTTWFLPEMKFRLIRTRFWSQPHHIKIKKMQLFIPCRCCRHSWQVTLYLLCLLALFSGVFLHNNSQETTSSRC